MIREAILTLLIQIAFSKKKKIESFDRVQNKNDSRFREKGETWET